MNRLTAIGLASLVAYGLLIASKYTGVVSAAKDERSPVAASSVERSGGNSGVRAVNPEPHPSTLVALPSPVPRAQVSRLSGIALEFRTSRDLKAFADTLAARAPNLSGDERYYLAKTLEECLFATTVNEDLAAYSAKQKRQFLAGLPTGDPINEKRIAAYEAADNTSRCLGFQNAKISQKDIDALYRAAAQQGDPRAQARIVTAELSKNLGKSTGDPAQPTQPVRQGTDEQLSMLIGLLESRDPEALIYVGQFLAQNAVSQNLRIGANGEVPEPSAFLGAFTLVACDVGQDCTRASLNRDLLQACAYGGYCDPQSFEEFYQNFLASPWTYAQAMRYRSMIHTAIDQRNWGLIGLTPKLTQSPVVPK
jgi:hypothetical protein